MKDDTVTAVVLGAGVGKRLWPLTVSKTLLPFAGEPLLISTIRSLASVGYKNIVVVATPQDGKVIGSWRVPEASLRVVIQSSPTGMGDAVLLVHKVIGDVPVLILNAQDVVDDSLYARVWEYSQEKKPFVVGRKVERYFDGGYLKMKDDRLVEIVEKPGAGREPSKIVNLVFHFFPNLGEFASALAGVTTKNDDLYERGLAAFAGEYMVGVHEYDGIWQPLKYPWNILDVLAIRLGQLHPHRGRNVEVGKNVEIVGSVVLEDDVRIFENTKIVGPCYIGRGTIIGNNTIIRESHIGAHSIVGFYTDIARSWIGEGCWFHNNYVGDSVLEENVSLGGGTRLANLRLDEKGIFSTIAGKKMPTGRNKLGAIIGAGVRTGVNASIMPGVKIGSNSFVGAGVVLGTDVPDGSWCVVKQELQVLKNRALVSNPSREEFRSKL